MVEWVVTVFSSELIRFLCARYDNVDFAKEAVGEGLVRGAWRFLVATVEKTLQARHARSASIPQDIDKSLRFDTCWFMRTDQDSLAVN